MSDSCDDPGSRGIDGVGSLASADDVVAKFNKS